MKKVAGETTEDQKRLQRELDSAAGAVENRTQLQQRFVLLERTLARGENRGGKRGGEVNSYRVWP